MRKRGCWPLSGEMFTLVTFVFAEMQCIFCESMYPMIGFAKALRGAACDDVIKEPGSRSSRRKRLNSLHNRLLDRKMALFATQRKQRPTC
jgi:hypothetical protein